MPTTKAAYWHEMKEKAAANIASITGWIKPGNEEDLKKHVAYVMRSGDSHEKAEVLIEAVEFMAACHMLNVHELPN